MSRHRNLKNGTITAASETLKSEPIVDSPANGEATKVSSTVIFAPVVLALFPTLGLVFGGCCSNVWACEELLFINHRIGSALTFLQMLFITLQSLPSFFSFSKTHFLPQLKPRQIPLHQWGFQVVVLITSSLLSNWVFAYDVPLTVQIVFRSGSLAVSMLFGYLFSKKKYNGMQILSIVIVTVGVVLATLSRPSSTSKNAVASPPRSPEQLRAYTIGIIMLVVSLFSTGLLGLLQEKTYQKYGPHWREGVFYTHALSLPMFIFLRSDITQGLASLSRSASGSSPVFAYTVLAANVVSQLICVSSVNRLTSQVSSVSTHIVLTARKAISLCFSMWWFSNGWNTQLAAGAAMVFTGSFMYAMGVDKQKQQ
ncbi:hypothetical protein AGABI1DRAFT_58864 [Agaricus bisporus var. burnettii JB137-S8]|uniref:UAA transporter n=1 Tax=Agaricus bisporus var. burnettii (strain JB137-S8 / ATCC MYA-4627 / FGSC 10392) TaxID=597362 RepID=K5WV30_AGABU|nr:uncharacterized protein AGABI1DRAFT_58864 [Agaricus bisporus var. burnettii JB137-S8]EKM79336.1 hypothetical protein AGABI1DRAFT_58864 [Agaricus bisporus var. burnettii JB137-S8]